MDLYGAAKTSAMGAFVVSGLCSPTVAAPNMFMEQPVQVQNVSDLGTVTYGLGWDGHLWTIPARSAKTI